MKNKNLLFELIKSLTKSEKRYFKIYSSLNSSKKKNSLLLFEAIDKQEKYDEKKIMKLLSREAVIDNFSYNKHYLLQLILKSLHAYNYGKNSEEILRENLHHLELLFEKSQFALCEKIITKSLQLAENEELFFYINEFLNWKSKFRYTKFNRKQSKEEYDLIVKTQAVVLKQEINLIQYRDLYMNFHLVVAENPNRDKSHLTKINKFITHPLLQKENQAISLKAKYYYYFIHRMNFLLLNDLDNALDCSLKLVENFEKKIQSYSNEHHQFYANALTYLLLDQAALAKIDDYRVTNYKLTSFLQKHVELAKFIFPTNYSAAITLYRKTKNYDSVATLVAEYEHFLKSFNENISSQNILILNFQIACLFIEKSDFKAALRWINVVLSEKDELRKDIFTAAKIINLIVHYELNNYDLLDSEIISTYRYLLKKNRLHKFEAMIIKYMKSKITKATNKTELNTVFREMLFEIESMANDSKENFFLTYFDFRLWLKSKI